MPVLEDAELIVDGHVGRLAEDLQSEVDGAVVEIDGLLPVVRYARREGEGREAKSEERQSKF